MTQVGNGQRQVVIWLIGKVQMDVAEQQAIKPLTSFNPKEMISTETTLQSLAFPTYVD